MYEVHGVGHMVPVFPCTVVPLLDIDTCMYKPWMHLCTSVYPGTFIKGSWLELKCLHC